MTSPIAPHESISIVRTTTTGHSQHSRVTPLAEDAQKGVAKDLQGCCIGPMPPDEFYDKYLPNSGRVFSVDLDFFDGINNDDPETDRYKPFVSLSFLLNCTRRD